MTRRQLPAIKKSMESVRWQHPALSREANTDVTKTVIHRLDARGVLQKGVNPINPPPMLKFPTLQQKKHVYSLVQKVVLVYIANFVLHDNCEESELFYNSSVEIILSLKVLHN